MKQFFYRILEHRHFWRYASFGEIAELYASRTLRLAAINIGAGFTSVFLYKSGYSLAFIMGFWGVIYFGKAVITPLAGIMVARIGTAHGTLISNLLYIPAMAAIGFMPELGFSSLLIFAICAGISGTIYEICYFVEFSVIKNPIHAGKEIGFMNIIEKLVITTAPVIGGFIALTFGVHTSMLVASLLFALAALPLLKAASKTEKKQRITLQGFPWRMALPSMVAKTSSGFDIVASSIVWGLFVMLFVFPKAGDDIYVIIGALSSVTVIVAIVTSILYGQTIDRQKGGKLLKIGVIGNSLVHLSRVFTITPIDTLGINVVNEVATTAQNMSFLRGMFDIADISGHRIMYLVAIDVFSSMGAALACLAMVLCESLIGGISSFHAFFVISAIAILGVGLARFPIYKKH